MAVWDLCVTLEELGAEIPPLKISVTSDLHIGGVILKVVEKSQLKRDWSDHALWWEQKQQWLLKPSWTLDKCGIHADARLCLTPQHKPLQLVMPSGIIVRMRKKKKDKDAEENVYDITCAPLPSSTILKLANGMPAFFAEKPETETAYKMLAASQPPPAPETIAKMYFSTNLVEKAQINSRWLDSSRSLLQQGVKDDDKLLLRFKYYSFLDIEPKTDVVRLTQLYEQARWAILLEDIECTEEEMMVFAALQYHIGKVALTEQPVSSCPAMDDLDSALQSLEVKLEGESSADILETMTAPELHDYLKIFRPKRLTLKGFKQFWFTFKETTISYYKSKEESSKEPIQQMNLKGCEVAPDVNVAGKKFCIRLLIPGPEGMNEVYLRCEHEQQYSRWMAACRLASKGKTLADSSFTNEVQSIQSFLAMQKTSPSTNTTQTEESINTHSLVCLRYQKKYKPKQKFLQIWQALPDFGLSYVVVRFKGCRKDEVLGIANNRLIRIDLGIGDIVKTWRYNTMRQWNVNWDIKQMAIEFDGNVNVAFNCVTANCKIVHEYIGGYIFMSTRSRDQSDTLNEELFHKLTGGHEAL
ncbi:hypothetical protein DNTS_005246 [Danionella cerebrum]|uniref:PH domain-containing protein n=1 Tax=Danionella cerebrum TaxID=2873325 RepID=A0A553PUE9_9TELE|nr:hypothetical protein DNTS_005246 [Danionella translucida]